LGATVHNASSSSGSNLNSTHNISSGSSSRNSVTTMGLLQDRIPSVESVPYSTTSSPSAVVVTSGQMPFVSSHQSLPSLSPRSSLSSVSPPVSPYELGPPPSYEQAFLEKKKRLGMDRQQTGVDEALAELSLSSEKFEVCLTACAFNKLYVKGSYSLE